MDLYKALKQGMSCKELQDHFSEELEKAVKRINEEQEKEKMAKAREEEIKQTRSNLAKILTEYIRLISGNSKLKIEDIQKLLTSLEKELNENSKMKSKCSTIKNFNKNCLDDVILNNFIFENLF